VSHYGRAEAGTYSVAETQVFYSTKTSASHINPTTLGLYY
jgi:hypothetical protein